MKKLNELNQLKLSIMTELEKCVDNMLNQLQANEVLQDRKWEENDLQEEERPNIVLGYFDGGLSMHLPPNQGSNGTSGWHISCQPNLMLRPSAYPDRKSFLKATSKITYKKD